MTTVQILKILPRFIDYVGYRFRLEFINNQYGVLSVGYFLSELRCKTPYKKASFKAGYWTEKRVEFHLSSVGSNYLFHTTLWNDENESLLDALQTLYHHLIECRILEPILTEGVENAEFTEIPQLYLTSNF